MYIDLYTRVLLKVSTKTNLSHDPPSCPMKLMNVYPESIFVYTNDMRRVSVKLIRKEKKLWHMDEREK